MENGYQETFYGKFKVGLADPNRFGSLGELVAIGAAGWAYGAGKTVIRYDAQHRVRDLVKVWTGFFGVLLIAVFCWLLPSAILGEGWLATCLAILLFI